TIVLRYRGRTREMRAELNRLLPALRSSPRADPRDLVRALRNSANLAIYEGNYPAASFDAAEALALSRARYGERGPETATSSRVLALARWFGHQPALALAAAEEALRLTLAVYGGNAKHPSVSEARAFYGRALAGVGRYRESSAALVQAAHDAGEVFGESSM